MKFPFAFLALCLLALPLSSQAAAESIEKVVPERIVSLASSLTEIVYLLDMEERLVGVTRFCNYPPDAQKKVKVGALLDPNIEAIVLLQSDLVLLLDSQKDIQRRLSQLTIRTVAFKHETVADILATIDEMGVLFHREKESASILKSLHTRLYNVKKLVSEGPLPKVMISIGRDLSSPVNHLFIAGKNTFYDELITLAGGTNVWNNGIIAFPQITLEGVIRLAPDLIVDLVGSENSTPIFLRKYEKQWADSLGELMSTARITIVAGDHALRPGPRIVNFVEELSALINDWKSSVLKKTDDLHGG